MMIMSAQNADYILKPKNNIYLGYGNKMLPMVEFIKLIIIQKINGKK